MLLRSEIGGTRFWRCVLIVGALGLAACDATPVPPSPPPTLAERGRDLFFNETFAGNGRTCGTCHPASNNLTLDAAFIATLPASDPLFVADTTPDLGPRF